MKKSQAFSVVFSGITINNWSREDVLLACNLVENLISVVPVYEFHCTKDEEAVKVLANIIEGEINLERY